jgi:hypothetical protein
VCFGKILVTVIKIISWSGSEKTTGYFLIKFNTTYNSSKISEFGIFSLQIYSSTQSNKKYEDEDFRHL